MKTLKLLVKTSFFNKINGFVMQSRDVTYLLFIITVTGVYAAIGLRHTAILLMHTISWCSLSVCR